MATTRTACHCPSAGAFTLAEVAAAFALDDRTRECLAAPPDEAVFDDHGRYIHITT
jgi:hypothetical protein